MTFWSKQGTQTMSLVRDLQDPNLKQHKLDKTSPGKFQEVEQWSLCENQILFNRLVVGYLNTDDVKDVQPIHKP